MEADNLKTTSANRNEEKQFENLRRRAGSHVETFEDVLRRGATEIPQPEDITAAFSFLIPEIEKAAEEMETFTDHPDPSNTWAGYLKRSTNYALDTLRYVGHSINENAVKPVAQQVAIQAMPAATAWGKYLVAIMQDITPQRAQNIFRILGNATVNAFGLIKTEGGKKFISSLRKAVESWVDVISSPVGRQMLIETSAGAVKLAEALDTPEAKSAICHFATVAERFVDVLSSDECRQMFHDISHAICKGIELANSPESTVMVAEITANVCYALEMESLIAKTRMQEKVKRTEQRGHYRPRTTRSASWTSLHSARANTTPHEMDEDVGAGKIVYEEAILSSFHRTTDREDSFEGDPEWKQEHSNDGHFQNKAPAFEGVLSCPGLLEVDTIEEKSDDDARPSNTSISENVVPVEDDLGSMASRGSKHTAGFDHEALTAEIRKRRSHSLQIQKQRTSSVAMSEKLESNRRRFLEHLEKQGRSLTGLEQTKPKRPEEGGLVCCFIIVVALLWLFFGLYGIRQLIVNFSKWIITS